MTPRLSYVYKYVDRDEVRYFSSFERAKECLDKNAQDYRTKGAQMLSSKSANDIPYVWRVKIHFPWSGRIFEITIEEIELDILPKKDPY